MSLFFPHHLHVSISQSLYTSSATWYPGQRTPEDRQTDRRDELDLTLSRLGRVSPPYKVSEWSFGNLILPKV